MAGDEASAERDRPRRGRPRLDAQMVPRILDAAERLFARRGPFGVSVRDIAREASIPHSAIYRYFESKDALLRSVLERGRARQRERDVRSRRVGDPLGGAVEWLMTGNRAYMLTAARAALEGQTATSLGLERDEAAGRQLLRVLEGERYEFSARADHDPRMIAAAVMALAMGWAVAEEWVLDAAGLEDCDVQKVRQELSEIMGSLMALGRGERGECD
jgi:AcrR family transcriptional regulator